MPGLLDGAVALLDRRRLTSVWVPLAAFLAAVAGVVAAGAGWGTTMLWWNGLAADTRVLLGLGALVATVVLGQFLDAAQTGLIRCYEGHWPDRRILNPLRDGLRARHLAAQRRRDPRDPELFLTYPRTAAHTLPTRLGNILRAAEEHGDRYGLDAVGTWPRLYGVLPDAFRASFAQAAAALEAAVTVSFLGGLFAIVGGVLGTLLLPGPGAAGCVWGGALVAVLGYRGAVRAARPYAQLVRAAYDVHRFLLLEAMGLRLPSGPGAERAQWEQLGKVWYLGAADFDQAGALRYPTEQGPGEPRVPARPAPPVPVPVPAGPPGRARSPRRSRVRAVLAAAVLLAGALAWTAADTLPARPSLAASGTGVRAARDLTAFHVLTRDDLRRARGPVRPSDLVGRYTLRPVPRGRPVRPAGLGPRLAAGRLAGRIVTTVTVSTGADRVRPGQTVGARGASAWFTDLLVLDVQAKDALIVAVRPADLDRLSRDLRSGPLRLTLPAG